jgi:hypothetical protein
LAAARQVPVLQGLLLALQLLRAAAASQLQALVLQALMCL